MDFVVNLHLILQISGNQIDVTGCWDSFNTFIQTLSFQAFKLNK
jgi:hypothetical protein